MKARNFRYVRPSSLQEAYRILAEADGEAVPIAGGQSLLAGLNMRALRAYGLCMAGAVCAVIPCVSAASCPCIFGAVIGIWAIVVLASPEVRDAFR